MRLNKIPKQKSLKLDLKVLEKLATPFRIELRNRFDTLKDEEPSIEKMNKSLQNLRTPYKIKQKSTIKKSTEDTEIESLHRKRKELWQKANKTLKDKAEYAELNKLVKKKCRTRARRKRKELIQEMLEARKGPRQINKHRNIKTITSMRKEEEILKICAVCLLVGCLTSQQQASVSQGRICSDNFTCRHTEIEVADQTFYLTQSQYTDTGPTSPSADPITPGAWQGSHWSANF